jgi:hypothetical protein
MRIPVSTDKYIMGASGFMVRNEMHLMARFVVINTNTVRSKTPKWVGIGGTWMLQNHAQVFGVFDPTYRRAAVWWGDRHARSTSSYVRKLAQYLEQLPRNRGKYRRRWWVTYYQSTEPLDHLRILE